MDLDTLLSLLNASGTDASSSYHHQSPSHASPAQASHHRGHTQARAFTPSFDITETPQAYVLEGELPGMSDKKSVDIEFTDHQTLLVKGKIEKVDTAKQVTSTEEAETERPKSPHQPTIEDVIDEDDAASTTILTPTSTVFDEKKQPKKEQIRYWVSERTIGSFQRTFSFPGLVDQEKVTATLKDGILTIVVPKKTKAPTRKIEIQ